MKFVPIICLALIFATPAFAAPQWVETACWKAANRVLPALGAREREAYIVSPTRSTTTAKAKSRSKFPVKNGGTPTSEGGRVRRKPQ